MKKAVKTPGSPVRAGKGVPKTIDEYLSRVPLPTRALLEKVRAAIKSAAPREATEGISYRIPAISHNGVLVWFAAYRTHWSLFPTSSVMAEFSEELKRYPTSRGTIRFPLDRPPPIGLVKRIVRARVLHNSARRPR